MQYSTISITVVLNVVQKSGSMIPFGFWFFQDCFDWNHFLCDVKIFRIFKTYFLKEVEALKVGVM